MWVPGAGRSPKGRDAESSSEFDLKAETVEALAVGKLARTGTVAERAPTRAVRGPTLWERRRELGSWAGGRGTRL